MPKLFLIERERRFTEIDRSEGEWESGYWVLSEQKANSLTGGTIYFLMKQSGRSYFGGVILGFRVQNDGEFSGRIVFRFRSDNQCREVLAGRGRWARVMKIDD